jgi:hypothetical protein
VHLLLKLANMPKLGENGEGHHDNNTTTTIIKRNKYHKLRRDKTILKIKEMMVANHTTDEIIAAFPDIPERSIYRYIYAAYLPDLQAILSPTTQGIRTIQAISVYVDQAKRKSRKLETILDDPTQPAKNRVEAAMASNQLDFIVAKSLTQLYGILNSKEGVSRLLASIEGLIKEGSSISVNGDQKAMISDNII